jgi:Flp pilus assembly protein TadG
MRLQLSTRSPSADILMSTGASQRPGTADRGQILVIFVAGFVAIVLLLGLVIDGGNVFAQRRQGQNTADLQAMAGTKVISDHYTTGVSVDVYGALTATADQNACASDDGTPCTWAARYVGPGFSDLGPVTPAPGLPANTIGVKVDVERLPSTYLLRVVGQDAWKVSTTATAIVSRAPGGPSGQLLPIALYGKDADGNDRTFEEGQVYDITNGKNAPGSFGYLSWTGSNSAGALADSICAPNNPSFTLPAKFPVDPGKSNSSAVRGCLRNWIDSGATVLVPIYSSVSAGGNGEYTVTGLAAMVLTSIDQPAVDDIQGYFVGVYPYTSVPGGITRPPTPNDSLVFLGLVK